MNVCNFLSLETGYGAVKVMVSKRFVVGAIPPGLRSEMGLFPNVTLRRSEAI